MVAFRIIGIGASGAIGAAVCLLLMQAAFASSSREREQAQTAALLADHDARWRISTNDDGFRVEAEIASCGFDPAKVLGEMKPPDVSQYASGRWSPYDGFFDLLLYREAHFRHWVQIRREERLLAGSTVLWRAALMDCVQLPAVSAFCSSILDRRLTDLGAESRISLPTGAKGSPIWPRQHRIICTFAAGLLGTQNSTQQRLTAR